MQAADNAVLPFQIYPVCVLHLAGEGKRGSAGRLEVTVASAEDVSGAVSLLGALDLVEGACASKDVVRV